MYTEELKERVGGVVASFILKNGELIESDLERSPQFVIHSVLYLMDAVIEKKDIKKFVIFGENANFSVSFHLHYIIGVLLERTANIHLLRLMIRRILEPTEQVAEPYTLEE